MKRLFSLTALVICTVMLLSALPFCVSAAEFAGDDRIVIVLDPGHGTAGEPSEYNYSEGSYNMRTSKYLKAALEANSSFIVYMTNEKSNVDLSHYERATFADSVNADLLISVHYNSSPNPDLNGMEAWSSVIPKFDTSALAKMCVDYGVAAVPELINGGVYQRKDNAGFYWNEEYQWDIEGDPSSGVLSDYYGIITWGLKFGVPTFILEEMYLSNEHDRALATDANIKAIAEAQAQAIIDYYTGHEHTYGEMQTDIPLSCITPGKQSEHCTECGHRKNVTTLADAPDPEAHFYRPVNVNDPDGEWTCVYTHSLINKAKLEHEHHTGDSLQGVVLPNDTNNNGDTAETPEEPEPPKGEDGHVHDYEVTAGYEVTGGQSGFAIYTCSVCGDKYRENLYATYDCEANGHVLMAYSRVPGYSEQYIDTVATCETDGEQYCFCMVCNYAGNIIEPATGHQYTVVNEVAATCEVVGKVEKLCTLCAKSVIEDIPATGHDFERHTELSCSEEGKQIDRCTLCAKENIVSLPPADHKYESRVKSEATATSDGVREYVCTVCAHTYTEPIPAKGTAAFDIAKAIDLPLPIIAFIIAVILLVAAVIIVPVIIRKKREKDEQVPIEAMDFSEESVAPAVKEHESDAALEETTEEMLATMGFNAVELCDADDIADLTGEVAPVIVAEEDDFISEDEVLTSPTLDEDEADGLVSEVIPEIAQAVEEPTAEKKDVTLGDIGLERTSDEPDDTPLEEAIEALKRSLDTDNE